MNPGNYKQHIFETPQYAHCYVITIFQPTPDLKFSELVMKLPTGNINMAMTLQ